MLERVGRRFDLRPKRLAGDTVYGAVRLLKWLVDRNITPHVPVWDKSARSDGKFSRDKFTFDKERNVYICPAGAALALRRCRSGTHSALPGKHEGLPGLHAQAQVYGGPRSQGLA
jgi:hypothetical protein